MSHKSGSCRTGGSTHRKSSHTSVQDGGARRRHSSSKRRTSTRSRTGKLRVLPKVKRTMSLRKYGYSSSKPSSTRKAILMRIVRHEDPLAVARRLQLIANYVRLTDPARYMIYRHDAGMLFRLYQSLRESHGLSSHRTRRVRRVVKRRRTTRSAPRRRVAKRRSSTRRH